MIGWSVMGAFFAENKFSALVGAVDVGIRCATDAKLTLGRFKASEAASRLSNSIGAAGVEVFLRFRLPPTFAKGTI